jgi:hypothetical protein
VTTTKPAASPFPQRNDDGVDFSGFRVCRRPTTARMASISSAHAKRGVCAFKEISMLEAFFLMTLIGAAGCLITGAIDHVRGR